MIFYKIKPFYIIVRANKIEVRDIEEGRSIIRNATTHFSHRRSVIADYQQFEILLRDTVNERSKRNWLSRPIAYVIHVMQEGMSDLTEVEKRALRDSSEHTGAKQVTLFEGKYSLSDTEVLELIAKNVDEQNSIR